jgi:hypothetical protein
MVGILPGASLGRAGMTPHSHKGCSPCYFWGRGITMDMEAIVSLFSNLAVPVACLIATFYLWNKEREDHKQEQKELTEAIANNTLVMQKLVDKLDKDGD